MRSFDELLKESSFLHGHLCAGQVLGVRMAMVGCREVGIDEPRGCKKLIVYVETDRCATDAVQAVTGCSLGKRTLKFLDYGKMAATFVNLETNKAVRVLARDEARTAAPRYCQDSASPGEAQKKAYAVMPDEDLFSIQSNQVVWTPDENMPGFRGGRVFCDKCGEGINFRREIKAQGRALCIPCARGSYLPKRETPVQAGSDPEVVLIVGYKKVGKTTLIEKLIPELSSRGYRVATVKHHHSDFPAESDSYGTDSWRHRNAGAKSVALVTPTNIAVFHQTGDETSLDQIIPTLQGTDIVLVEGFHLEPRAKIEVLSGHKGERLCAADKHLLAVVGPTAGNETTPSFEPDSIKPLADLIESQILGRSNSLHH